jgi:hypothetical protein
MTRMPFFAGLRRGEQGGTISSRDEERPILPEPPVLAP